jgi:transcriptional regulator with XRE-family HTH domain
MPVTSRAGKTIRKRREALNLSQEAVARAADISTMGLHYIETGKRYPKLDTMERLSLAVQSHILVILTEAAFGGES